MTTLPLTAQFQVSHSTQPLGDPIGPWEPNSGGPWKLPEESPWRINPPNSPWTLPEGVFPTYPGTSPILPQPEDITPYTPTPPITKVTVTFELTWKPTLCPSQVSLLNEQLHKLYPTAPYFNANGTAQPWAIDPETVLELAHLFIYFGFNVRVRQILLTGTDLFPELGSDLILPIKADLDIPTLQKSKLYALVSSLFHTGTIDVIEF